MTPQSRPAGELNTVPVPAPVLLTVSVGDKRVKLALTVCACDIVTLQEAVEPLQAPDQPLNAAPAFGDAVNVTVLF